MPSASAAPKAFSTFSAPAASTTPDTTAAAESGANANDDELTSFVTPPKLATIDNREHYIINLPTVAEHEPDSDSVPDPNTDPDPDPTTDPDPVPDPNTDPNPQPTPDPDPVPSPDPNPGVNPSPEPDPGNNTSTVTGSETQNNQVKAKQTSSEGNKEKALPKTADISNFGVLAGLGALAILGGFGVYVARKKLGRK